MVDDDVSEKEKEEKVSAIVDFLWCCPADEAKVLLGVIQSFESCTLMGLLATLLPGSRGLALAVIPKYEIDLFYVNAHNAINNPSAESDVHDDIATFMLTCPDGKLVDFVNVTSQQEPLRIYSIFVSLLVISRKIMCKKFSESEIDEMYLLNKKKMHGLGLYSGK